MSLYDQEFKNAVKAGVMKGCCRYHCTSKTCDCNNHTCEHLTNSANNMKDIKK